MQPLNDDAKENTEKINITDENDPVDDPSVFIETEVKFSPEDAVPSGVGLTEQEEGTETENVQLRNEVSFLNVENARDKNETKEEVIKVKDEAKKEITKVK